MVRLALVLLGLVLAPNAFAGCADPNGEGITRGELSTTLNNYTEESAICVTRRSSNCPECQPGYIHQCSKGHWEAFTRLPCEDQSGSPSGGNQVNENHRPTTDVAESTKDQSSTDYRRLWYDSVKGCTPGEFPSYGEYQSKAISEFKPKSQAEIRAGVELLIKGANRPSSCDLSNYSWAGDDAQMFYEGCLKVGHERKAFANCVARQLHGT